MQSLPKREGQYSGIDDLRRLRQMVEEAALILSRHDGMHLLHNDVTALLFLEGAAKNGVKVDPDAAERIMRRMRKADSTGVYPMGGS